ncbi:MAG: hypothetical protein JNK04_10500 [Myxococcales bacterium]|nr:hypothetical protein [Myxococcales bacterium]
MDRDLPMVCLRCGSTSNVGQHRVFLEGHGGRERAILLGLWGVLFWWIGRSSQPGALSVQIPVCRPCDSQWNLWRGLASAAWIASALSIFVLRSFLPAPIPTILSLVLLPVAGVLTWLSRRHGVPVYRGRTALHLLVERVPKSALELIAEEQLPHPKRAEPARSKPPRPRRRRRAAGNEDDEPTGSDRDE